MGVVEVHDRFDHDGRERVHRGVSGRVCAPDDDGLHPSVGGLNAFVHPNEKLVDKLSRFLQRGAPFGEVPLQERPEEVVQPSGTVSAVRVLTHDGDKLKVKALHGFVEGTRWMGRHSLTKVDKLPQPCAIFRVCGIQGIIHGL